MAKSQTVKAATKSNKALVNNVAPKAKDEVKTAVLTMLYSALLKAALSGDYGILIQRFYASALAYHFKAETSFPRARNATEPLLSIEDAALMLRKHEKTSIPAGLKSAQRLFDQMVIETFPSGKITKK